mmetsp:Transcript_25121/g.42926  ORF Transcript_25121/g.42926 Transcript_25121/m.42926 type:complete len:96 (-) Transcript_25121:13-300(-)
MISNAALQNKFSISQDDEDDTVAKDDSIAVASNFDSKGCVEYPNNPTMYSIHALWNAGTMARRLSFQTFGSETGIKPSPMIGLRISASNPLSYFV